MAISATHYAILRRLQPILPQGGSLLEIGEANWYGDIEPDVFLCQGIFDSGKPGVYDGLTNWCRAVDDCKSGDLHAIAKACYASLFAPSRIVSIDMNGTPSAWRCDLNLPLPPLGQFDVVINHGTAEHVFNIAQVFASIHAACKVGGLMIHEAPFTGWIDHGFYCLQPTLFYDVAAANGYEIVSVDIEEIKTQTILPVKTRQDVAAYAADGKLPLNAMLFVVLRKLANSGFQIPPQGYYAKALSEAGKEAWETLR